MTGNTSKPNNPVTKTVPQQSPSPKPADKPITPKPQSPPPQVAIKRGDISPKTKDK